MTHWKHASGKLIHAVCCFAGVLQREEAGRKEMSGQGDDRGRVRIGDIAKPKFRTEESETSSEF